MKMFRKLLSVAVISLLMTHCKEPKPYVITCTDGVVPYSETGGTNKTFRFKNDNPEVTERAMVIQSEIEFNSYLDPTSFGNAPQIDFDSKTLLVGRKNTNNVSALFQQEVISDCKKKIIDYNVIVRDSGIPSLGVAYYYAVIPKISADTKVNFNIVVQ